MQETSADGSRATFAALGGKGAYRKGVGVVYSNEKSFRDAMLAAGALATSYYGAASAQAAETTRQVAEKEGTKRAATASAAEVQKAAIAAQSAVAESAIKAGAEVAPVVVTSP